MSNYFGPNTAQVADRLGYRFAFNEEMVDELADTLYELEQPEGISLEKNALDAGVLDVLQEESHRLGHSIYGFDFQHRTNEMGDIQHILHDREVEAGREDLPAIKKIAADFEHYVHRLGALAGSEALIAEPLLPQYRLGRELGRFAVNDVQITSIDSTHGGELDWVISRQRCGGLIGLMCIEGSAALHLWTSEDPQISISFRPGDLLLVKDDAQSVIAMSGVQNLRILMARSVVYEAMYASSVPPLVLAA